MKCQQGWLFLIPMAYCKTLKNSFYSHLSVTKVPQADNLKT